MLLLHRLTSFFLAFVVALSLVALFLFPSFAFFILGILLLIVGLLYARLLVWEYRKSAFWVFLLISILFLFSFFFPLFVYGICLFISPYSHHLSTLCD